MDVPAPTVGAIGEILVAADLLAKGFAVFRSMSPACYCDLLAEKEGEILAVEVKTSFQRKDRLYFPNKIHPRVTCLALWNKETLAISYWHPRNMSPLNP
jgi:Holliday junction resolvase